MPNVPAILDAYPAEYQPAAIEPLGSAGGMSGAQFWRIKNSRGSSILRRWPAEFQSAERLRFIHDVLRHASTRGADFLPLPITARAGESFVEHAGYLWELAPWMPSTADFAQTPTIAKLKSAMRALAQFHNAVADFSQEPDADFPEKQNAVARHFSLLNELQTPTRLNELWRSVDGVTWPDLTPLAREFTMALPRAVSSALGRLEPLTTVHFTLQPCLRDIWHDHVFFVGNAVSAFVDFGAIAFDTPTTDIARLLNSLASCTLPRAVWQSEGSYGSAQTWRVGLAAYSELRPLTEYETRAAHALATSGNLLAGCNWIRWLYIDRRRFENRDQVIARFEKIVAATRDS